MSKVVALFALVVPALLAGCTTYSPRAFNEIRLAQNVYRIEAAGNAFTTPQRTSDLVMVRAAELALRHGFQYVHFSDAQSWQVDSSIHVPGEYASSTMTTGNLYGNNFSAVSTTSGYYQPANKIKLERPHTAITVTMLREGETGAERFIPAAEILATVGPKVGYKHTR